MANSGSATPTADIAVMAQLRADGSVRDTFPLSSGCSITVGRNRGDWVFLYVLKEGSQYFRALRNYIEHVCGTP
jgi:hypothetical protein